MSRSLLACVCCLVLIPTSEVPDCLEKGWTGFHCVHVPVGCHPYPHSMLVSVPCATWLLTFALGLLRFMLFVSASSVVIVQLPPSPLPGPSPCPFSLEKGPHFISLTFPANAPNVASTRPQNQNVTLATNFITMRGKTTD